MERGILITIYGKLVKKVSAKAIQAIYKKYYKDASFVRVFDCLPSLKDVVGTNYCDIGFAISNKKIVIVGCIDNLIKGASGQAVQNMNIILGWDERLGLG